MQLTFEKKRKYLHLFIYFITLRKKVRRENRFNVSRMTQCTQNNFLNFKCMIIVL